MDLQTSKGVGEVMGGGWAFAFFKLGGGTRGLVPHTFGQTKCSDFLIL